MFYICRMPDDTPPLPPPALPLDDAIRERLVHNIAFALSGMLLSSKRKGGGWADDSVQRAIVAEKIVRHLELSGWLFGHSPPTPHHSATQGFNSGGET